MITVITVTSSTRTTHPTTMPTIQPVEHSPPEPDCAELMFTVVSGSVLWELESTSIVDVVSGTVVSVVDVGIVTAFVGSENKKKMNAL